MIGRSPEPDRTGDRTGNRTGDRTGPVLCSFKTGPDRTGPDPRVPKPDRTGPVPSQGLPKPDRTGPVQKFGPVPTAAPKGVTRGAVAPPPEVWDIGLSCSPPQNRKFVPR